MDSLERVSFFQMILQPFQKYLLLQQAPGGAGKGRRDAADDTADSNVRAQPLEKTGQKVDVLVRVKAQEICRTLFELSLDSRPFLNLQLMDFQA
jgi:hypothetical protein